MNVKQIRLATGLTQKQFCLIYQIPLKTLQNWEANQKSASARECPLYVINLLKIAIKNDFPKCSNLLDANIDESHLFVINHAKSKIKKSPLANFIKDVVLYGSTARGEAKPTSDVDILLVLDEKLKLQKNYNDWIIFLKGNISSDNFNVPETDLHVTFGSEWQQNDNAYFKNIKQEGFSIWN